MSTHTHFIQTKTRQRWGATLLTGLGLTGLVSGCGNSQLLQTEPVNAQNLPTTIPNTPTPTATPMPTLPPAATPTWTPVPTSTPWSTPTPWPAPQPWQPSQLALPTLAPVPLVPVSAPSLTGTTPVSYAPPSGVDVFGNTLLRWTFYGSLAPDEWFDIKIKPVGSNNSVFVDWTKSTEYALQPWSGWQPGLYNWQIGIVKGFIDENGNKNFIADTGRDSQSFVIKWQASGGEHSQNGSGATPSNNNRGGGGGTSGGS